MHILAEPFWAPKAGNTEVEYEDAYRPEGRCVGDRSVFRCAVADGATETSFSGLWADMLVEASRRGHLSGRGWQRALARLQYDWRGRVSERPLPWFAEQKVQQGAFSSLLGVTLTAPTGRARGPAPTGRVEGRWEAHAVGDSCLFHVRGSQLIRAFPLESSAELGNRPVLLSSNPASNAALSKCLPSTSGRWVPGDTFYLMTDALAHWFLGKIEECQCPRPNLRPLPRELLMSDFREWIDDLREDRQLRNDDVTLLRVDVT